MSSGFISISSVVVAVILVGRACKVSLCDDTSTDTVSGEAASLEKSYCDRGWDQFDVNEALFGAESTFDEEFYTTKLERIGREIEGESTRDIHIAEHLNQERGLQLNDKFDVDEEAKYSSVCRVEGYDDEEEMLLDSRDNLTFGVTSASDGNKASSGVKAYDEAWVRFVALQWSWPCLLGETWGRIRALQSPTRMLGSVLFVSGRIKACFCRMFIYTYVHDISKGDLATASDEFAHTGKLP
ncbi:PREDICTED: polyadenylate-binding protein-interacting protein 3-like [Tarenaya hassleriana]|uniref:polyadenylate-binding protein-interacting protein 3-like n=1 Tax=Tarenaya hassleriana TaxID=28532 RepID=UPI00053C8971|nr:PREDICTED: polyadenylate-binding protein-interacting protein 3-like [Tarenaya hassleriana]